MGRARPGRSAGGPCPWKLPSCSTESRTGCARRRSPIRCGGLTSEHNADPDVDTRLPEGSPALVLPELTRSRSRSETESSINGSIPTTTFDEEQVDLTAKAPIYGAFAEPSDGLEPSTPSYHLTPAAISRNPRQQIWPVSAVSAAGRSAGTCQWLRLLGSINAPSLVGSRWLRLASPATA
jgi:hypothetical protein